MDEAKIRELPEFPVERRYQFLVQTLLQFIIFLMGYIASRPISETTGIDPLLILLIIGFLSFTIYLLPTSHLNSSNKITPIPEYWNDRIIALQRLWFQTRITDEPLRSRLMEVYLSGLEMNYQAALIEGRDALAKRFRELIDKCENELRNKKSKK